MTRIDYNALLTPLIAKACMVQWIGCRTQHSGADGSNHRIGRYLFSAPEPKAQVHYCDHALSVVRPSVVCL